MNPYPTRLPHTILFGIAGAVLMLFGSAAQAAGVPNTFSSGQPVSSSQMNANFSAVESDIANPTITGNITMPNANAAGSAGVIMKGGVPFLHDYGTGNTFLGQNAGNFTMGGTGNTGVGSSVLNANTSGSSNTATGANALKSNTTGSLNTANGIQALYYNTTGTSNVAIGSQALQSNTSGASNTANGLGALFFNTTGYSNVASGTNALYSNVIGYNNTAIGGIALYSNQSGNNNIAIGYRAGFGVTGNYNIEIGNQGLSGEYNTIRIGDSNQSRTFIAGIYNATSTSGIAVYVNSSGQLGTLTSSRRFKDDITSMGDASDVLMKLRPVTFYYKADHAKHRQLQYGLVAEDVGKVAPQLVALNAKGQPYTVRYQFFAPMLLNEYQKQQHTIQVQAAQLKQQSAEIAEQKIQLKQQTQRVAALEQQSKELVALRKQVAHMSALLARLDRPEKVASSNP